MARSSSVTPSRSLLLSSTRAICEKSSTSSVSSPAAGGTVILLGHCNKHRSMDGRLIYEGVGDLKADVDNMFGLDPVNKPLAFHQELLVINEKDRSQISFEGGFKYKQTSATVGYEESVDSVQFATVDDITELKEKQRAQINIGKPLVGTKMSTFC